MQEDRTLQNVDAQMWVRFQGPELETRSLPIYELGQSLVAIQRIMNKAYLYSQGRLFLPPGLTPDERRKISLQVISRNKASDAYGLASFLSDPFTQQLLAELIAAGIVGIAGYVFQNVKGRFNDRLERHDNHLASATDETTFAISIYPEVAELVSRIGNIGGTMVIQITPSDATGQTHSIELTPDTKSYLKAIEGEIALGGTTSFSAKPRKLIPEQNVIEVTRGREQRTIKVKVSPESFDRVRYHPGKDFKVEFTGRPVFRIGSKLTGFSEFEAVSIQILEPPAPA